MVRPVHNDSSSGVAVEIPFMISGPMVDSMILSMADPRSDEVDAVESDTIMAPSDTALEWTSTWADSETSTDCVTVETLDTLVDWATEEESGRWTDDTLMSVLELVSGINTLRWERNSANVTWLFLFRDSFPTSLLCMFFCKCTP